MRKLALYVLCAPLCLFGCESKRTQPEDWDKAVALAAALDEDPSPDVYEVVLEARVADVEIVKGQQTSLYTYNGDVPGPLLSVDVGTLVRVRFHNALPEPTTVHWHGVRVDNAMDGSGMVGDTVAPGADFLYEFVARDPGTYWYHSHVNSSRQVARGLFGALVVRDPEEPAFGDELVLVLSDMQLNEDGSLNLNEGSNGIGDWFGREGSLLLVNGRVRPRLKMRTGVPQRWRLINAARTRFFLLDMAGQTFTQIGSDGGLFSPPRELEKLKLVPGERVDVVVTPKDDGTSLALVRTLDAKRFASELVREPEVVFDVLYDGSATPNPLPSFERKFVPFEESGVVERLVELSDVGFNAGAPGLGINYKRFPDGEVFTSHVGDREIWTIKNVTAFDHPFHLHGFFFRQLGAPDAWKDTINVPKNSSVRIAVHFDERPGMWMMHCHILDHAEAGMMGMVHLMSHAH